jgi:quercetin dioxygenase-like cupin family protein
MEVLSFKDCEDVKIEEFPFKGAMRKVTGTSVRWLSRAGDDGHGYPEYGLRYFTIQPGGEIPIHNHFYHQTMYILEGRFECWQFDMETEKVAASNVVGPGDFVYIPSMETHGMKNIGDTPATFLCCIANVYDDKAA